MNKDVEEARKIVGEIICQKKPDIKDLEALLESEPKDSIQILPDGSIASGWREELVNKFAKALNNREKQVREEITNENKLEHLITEYMWKYKHVYDGSVRKLAQHIIEAIRKPEREGGA